MCDTPCYKYLYCVARLRCELDYRQLIFYVYFHDLLEIMDVFIEQKKRDLIQRTSW
jgi:hypothetical protein